MQRQEIDAITSYQQGDRNAFGILYDTYIDQIYRFIYFKVQDTVIAEDLTSDVFFKALDKIDAFVPREDMSFRSWVYRIAHNIVIDFYRSKKDTSDITDAFDLGVEKNLACHIDDKDTLERVVQFLNTLKPIEKDVIIYRIWYDLSYREIADITGKSIDNCKQIVSRSLKKITSNIASIFLLLLLF